MVSTLGVMYIVPNVHRQSHNPMCIVLPMQCALHIYTHAMFFVTNAMHLICHQRKLGAGGEFIINLIVLTPLSSFQVV